MPIEAPKGEDEAPRLSAAGARIEVPRGMWYGEGVSPSPRNLLILTQYGGFWCILDVFFYNSATCFTRKTGVQPL